MGTGYRRGLSYAILRGPHMLHAHAMDMGCPCPKPEEERYRRNGLDDPVCRACRIRFDCLRCNREWDKRGYREEVA